MTSRKGPVYQSLLNVLVMLLPGGVVFYYGDEVGMLDIQLSDEKHSGQTIKLVKLVMSSLFTGKFFSFPNHSVNILLASILLVS